MTMSLIPQVCPRCNVPNARLSNFCDNCRLYLFDPTQTVERVTYNRRFWGSYLLDGLLILVTLFIGWLIWLWFTSKNGQTPAKSLLALYPVKMDTGRVIGRGDTWLREVVIKMLLFNGIGSNLTAGILPLVDGVWIFFDKNRQALHDKILSQTVVYAPAGVPESMRNDSTAPMLTQGAGAPAAGMAQAGYASPPQARPADAGVQSMAQDLAELARLRDQGMITADEYERRRARIVGGGVAGQSGDMDDTPG